MVRLRAHACFLFAFSCLVGCSSSNFGIASSGDGGDDTSTLTDASGVDTSGADSTTTVDGSTSDAIGTDGSAGDGTATDGSPSETLDARPICDRASFPMFVRACTNDESCSFGIHVTDCCGNKTAMGFNHSEKSRFDAAETAYEAACPAACGCPAGPISTDTGLTTGDASKIIVTCVSGTCKTSVK